MRCFRDDWHESKAFDDHNSPLLFLSFIIIISQTSYIDKDFQKQMVNGQSHVNINRLAETVSAVTKPLVRKLVFLPILFCFLLYLLFFLFTHLFISFTSLIFHQQSYDYCHNFLVLIFIPVTFLIFVRVQSSIHDVRVVAIIFYFLYPW